MTPREESAPATAEVIERRAENPDGGTPLSGDPNRKKPLKVDIAYPWISPLCTIVLVGCYMAMEQFPWLHTTRWLGVDAPILIAGFVASAVLLALIVDARRFFLQKRQTRRNIEKLELEIQYAWQSKKRLQQRTHIYSDHADKLKRFISDKLIEQIEYDEKFLHFKSIAAEIRHNGVISYDIVRSALEKAAKEEDQQLIVQGSLSDTHRFGLPNNPNSGSQQALQAMKYLWDLLDLSTADNIALHIGNQLIESEEQYYQIELNREQHSRAGEVPDVPTYSKPALSDMPVFLPSYAAIKAMGPYLQTEQMDRMIAQVSHAYKNAPQPAKRPECFENDQFRIRLDHTEHLLGNENHLILLLENLVKNAQFFSNKTRFKQKTDRIAVELLQRSGCIEFAIYNRGPHIREEDKEQIFQLGYSTRRVKEHHGKGLGLFFVNEIVKGYQGNIRIENIDNREHTYTVRIALAKNQVMTKVIERRIENDRPMLRELGTAALSDTLQWNFEQAIESVEVSSTVNPQTHVFTEFATTGTSHMMDPANPFMPEWLLEISRQSKKSGLRFTALDIKGAKFLVTLPTAESRLSGDEPEVSLG